MFTSNRFYTLLWLGLFCCCSAKAQQNQNTELAGLANGSFPVYKAVEKGYNEYKFESAAKPWPVELRKSGEEYAEILIKRAGVVDELYTADLPGFPAYFKNSTEIVVTAIDKKIYYYTYSIKTGAKIAYILSEKNPGKYADEKKKLDQYRENIKTLQTDTRTVRIEEKNAAEAKLAAENTLKDKNIKTIRIKTVEQPAAIGMLSIVAIGMEAELDNGTILRTKNLGGHTPYTDFETTVTGGDFAGGDLKVAADTRKIPNDKIEITARSKYQPTGEKGTLVIPLNYKSDIAYQYQGASGISGRGMTVGYSENGGEGKNGKSIRVKAESKNINGTSINHLTITNALTGEVMAEAKLCTTNTISINTSGGNGGNGCQGNACYSGNGGHGGNGGNGGDVHLSGNGAASLKIQVMNQGGKGGQGGARKTAAHTSGTAGTNGQNGIFYK